MSLDAALDRIQRLIRASRALYLAAQRLFAAGRTSDAEACMRRVDALRQDLRRLYLGTGIP